MGTSRAYARKGGSTDVQKSITANSKKFKAMTPAQKKTYLAKQAKSVAKGAVTWLPVLMIENSQQQRQTGAAVESFRNEVVKSAEKSQHLIAADLQHRIEESKEYRRYLIAIQQIIHDKYSYTEKFLNGIYNS